MDIGWHGKTELTEKTMINLEDVLAQDYLEESRERLATLETSLMAVENGGMEVEEGLLKYACRTVHSIKGGADPLGLVKIGELAHRMEDVLALVRSGEMVPTRDRIQTLRSAAGRLMELLQNPGESQRQEIAGTVSALQELRGEIRDAKRPPKTLLVEDDFASRLVLQTFLNRYGECHVAVNGKEAVEAFRSALDSGQGYDLICMDIMMPEMDGREAIRRVRALEQARGIRSTGGVKIVMTTALDDYKEVSQCFTDLCDAYLVKPIDLAKLLRHMRAFQLVD
jgi:two-component system, chemotaxis family, chemotaxis protein CheY